tara:strand:+ start:5052 stop:5612 length:561 start_codon:yes stop_codon:yes gene_type:complete
MFEIFMEKLTALIAAIESLALAIQQNPSSIEDTTPEEVLEDLELPTPEVAAEPPEGEELTRGQKAARTRKANKEKKLAEAAKEEDNPQPKSEDEEEDENFFQPNRNDVQAKLKDLMAEYTTDDTDEGKVNGRQVSLDLLSRYGVDSVNKLLLEHYQPLIDQADELIRANQISEDDKEDPLGFDAEF